MKAREIMSEDWLADRRRERALLLTQEYPDVKPGMYVQLITWFGDIWAEITRAYTDPAHPEWNRVYYISYEKYGVTRKESSASYGDIRKFATKDQIDSAHNTVMTPTGRYDHGYNVRKSPEPKRLSRLSPPASPHPLHSWHVLLRPKEWLEVVDETFGGVGRADDVRPQALECVFHTGTMFLLQE